MKKAYYQQLLNVIRDQLPHIALPGNKSELAREAAQGLGDLRTFLYSANTLLMASITTQYQCLYPDKAEIASRMSAALLRAVDHFDYTRGFKFSTYAYRILWKVLYGLNDEYRRHGRFLFGGRDTSEDSFLFNSLVQGPDPLGILREGSVAEIKQRIFAALDELIKDKKLQTRDVNILILRFGLGDDEPQTLETVGREFSLTRERIRQIEAHALRRLNDYFLSRDINPLD